MSTSTAWHACSTKLQRPVANIMNQANIARRLTCQMASFSARSLSIVDSRVLPARPSTIIRQLFGANAIRYASTSSSSSSPFSKTNNNSNSPGQTPPGTFATGTKWDHVNPIQASSDPAQTSRVVGVDHGEQSQIAAEVMEANFKKLQAIEKATKRRQAYSPYVLLSRLPPTVMPDDIKRMAKAEDDIVTIIYHRNEYMNFLGKATVVFKSATTATEFLTQHFGKFMSGHRLSMTMLDPFNQQDKCLIPPQMQPATFSGQAVLVSGLPLATRPDHLRSEFRKFHLMDTTEHAIVPVQSRKMASTCQYLIRLSSPSEAYRFVRTYHNTFYKKEEYRKRCPIRATVIY